MLIVCIFCIIKNLAGPHPWFLGRRLYMLGVSQIMWVSLLFRSPLDHTWVYANLVTYGGGGRAGETNHVVKGLGLWVRWHQSSLTSSMEERCTRDWVQSCGQWFNQSYLCYETPIKGERKGAVTNPPPNCEEASLKETMTSVWGTLVAIVINNLISLTSLPQTSYLLSPDQTQQEASEHGSPTCGPYRWDSWDREQMDGRTRRTSGR